MTRTFIRIAASAAAVAVLVFTAVPSSANPQGTIEHRKAVFSAIGGHMRAMVGIVKGEVPFKDDMAYHARAVNELARTVEHVFPQGSGQGDTRAKPEIWSKQAEFGNKLHNFQAAADHLDKTAKGGNMGAAAGAVGELGKACKACHDEFRRD